MIDYKKVNSDILNQIFKNKNEVVYQITEDEVLVGMFGNYVYAIPKQFCFIDFEKLEKPPFEGMSRFIKEGEDKEVFPCELTNERKIIPKVGKKSMGSVAKFELKDGNHMWVVEKYLDAFRGAIGYTTKGGTNPVYVHDETGIVGLILPIRIKEEASTNEN